MQVIERARPHASWKSFFPKRAELDWGRLLVLPRNELPPNGQLALLRQPTCADPTRRIHLRSSAAHRNFLSSNFPRLGTNPRFQRGRPANSEALRAPWPRVSFPRRTRGAETDGAGEGVRERGAISTLSAGMLPPAVLRWRARQMT